MRRLLALSVLALAPFATTAPAHAEGGLCARVITNQGTVIPHADSGEFCTVGILQNNWGYCYYDTFTAPEGGWDLVVCWPMP